MTIYKVQMRYEPPLPHRDLLLGILAAPYPITGATIENQRRDKELRARINRAADQKADFLELTETEIRELQERLTNFRFGLSSDQIVQLADDLLDALKAEV